MLLVFIAILLLIFLLFLGVPFMFSLGLVGFGGVVYVLGWEPAIKMIADYATRFVTPYILTCIPLFILMGYLAMQARITDDLFEVAYKWAGRLSGGLATSVVGACVMFGAITGTDFAAVGAMGRMAVGEMRKRDYYPPMAAACVAASSNLGTLIPPSIIAILYGMLMKVSAGKQIMAGLIPGLLTAVLYVVMIMTRAKISPALAPPAKGVPWKEAVASIPKVWPAVLIFAVIIGGIYSGFFTPTEAAAVGCIICLVMCLARNDFRWQPVKNALTESAHICGMVFGLLAGASMMKLFFGVSGVSQVAAAFFAGLGIPVWALTLVLTVPYLILGMFIDTLSIILLTLPIYYPIVTQAGIEPIMFGVLVVKLCAIAFQTPPLGFNILFIHGLIPDIPLMATFKEALWFILVDMIIVVLVIFLPAIATWIPSMM